jgi:hypothetical protein
MELSGGNHVEINPYRVPIGQVEWTCSTAVLLGTHTGTLVGLHGTLRICIFSNTDAVGLFVRFYIGTIKPLEKHG